MICARLMIGQSKVDDFHHVVHFAVYLLIPAPDDSVASLVEVHSASSIFALFGRFGVLIPVNFDGQAVCDTTKVNDLRTDAVLAVKFETAETPGSAALPELVLRVSRVSTQSAATLARRLVVGRHG
jgi:hypothetical protein